MRGKEALEAQLDIDLMNSRRAFPKAQELFEGGVDHIASASAVVGWHNTQTHPETGCVAIVREDGDFVDLVGEIVRVSRQMPQEEREVYVYVVGTGAILDDLSLARRSFFALGIYANESLECAIEVIGA